MGNTIGGHLNLCFDPGQTSSARPHDIAVYLPDPLDEGFGHSFCYIRPDPTHFSFPDHSTAPFPSISGASISANTHTPLSTSLTDPFFYNNKAASFESSGLFNSIPLQPIPRNSFPAVRSGPVGQCSGAVFGSGPIERGFLSGPIERSFISGPLENQSEQLLRYRPKSKKRGLMKMVKRVLSKSNLLSKNIENVSVSGEESLVVVENEEELFEGRDVEWAQGKAGEDRVHVVVCEEYGWVFVGIYDGFNGPDATDYLLTHLYSNVYKELKGLLWNHHHHHKTDDSHIICEELLSGSNCMDLSSQSVDDVLRAMSEALRKTEEAYLASADEMVVDNPELALMGSCVLVMLMKGDDVYLMNVGDSRAVLAQNYDLECIIFHDETTNKSDVDEFGSFTSLASAQLTIDHSTSVDEEVQRIMSDHRDDSSAVIKDRVKGSLKVTRAFGAGFLKQPKWNNALLETFRIDYVGNSPYISCSPALHHHRLGPKDRFLILSSDGLYQYFTNQEAVSEVETFMVLFPEGDPAQHLVEEVVFRAAKQAGLDFHELLDIPQGDRRKYHDDVSILIISFKGRMWRSSRPCEYRIL